MPDLENGIDPSVPSVVASIKTGNPHHFQVRCQIRSELRQLKPWCSNPQDKSFRGLCDGGMIFIIAIIWRIFTYEVEEIGHGWYER